MFQNISADRLETLLDQGRAFTLADVREPEEYRGGTSGGSCEPAGAADFKNNRTIWFF